MIISETSGGGGPKSFRWNISYGYVDGTVNWYDFEGNIQDFGLVDGNGNNWSLGLASGPITFQWNTGPVRQTVSMAGDTLVFDLMGSS